jgi:DNA-directed RNA polymerase I, II, and III subunit RPABC3
MMGKGKSCGVADFSGMNRKAYISFGGLLMSLEGPYKKLTPLRVDYVYLLARKR